MDHSREEDDNRFNIGDLASRIGCTVEAIRYYERLNIVPKADRSGSGRYRRYSEADAERFTFLRKARDLGFSLEEVRELLAIAYGDPTLSCRQVDMIAHMRLAQVESKIAQLTRLHSELSTVINRCEGGLEVAECRILGALSSTGDPS